MSTTLQFRRGNTTTSNAFTGAVGELFIDTDVNTLIVHDGITTGGTRLATEASVNTAVSNLVDTAPSTLDTLNELAAALGDDPNFATTISNQLGNKVDDTTQIIAGTGLTGGGTLDANRTLNVDILGIQNLSDPNADRIAFWDDSVGSFQWLSLGTNLSISSTTLNATNTNTTYSAGDLLDLSGTTFNVDLSELATSTTDVDGDFFVVVDSASNQRKLAKGNINISGFNNDAGFTTNVGDITGVSITAGTGLAGTVSTASGQHTQTLSLASNVITPGTYGSTSDGTKIDTITVDTYGRVTSISTGNVGDITGVTAGTGLSGGGTSGAVTLNLSHLGFQNLSDPNDDRIAFWDDSAAAFAWLDLGSNLSISGTTLNATDTNTTYSAGNGIALSTTTFSVSAGSGLIQQTGGLAHADTSSQVSVNNSNGTVIQDITLDTFGHITAIGSVNLDSRYVDITGDTMSGNLTVNANVTADAFFGDGSNLTGVSAGATVAEKSDSVTYNVIFTNETSGTQSNAYVNSSVLTFNASTGTLTSTDFDSLSDKRYKENIKTVENASDIVASLTGREFTWKESQKKSYGVIAQELEKAIPNLVSESDDGMKRVNYNGLLAFLIESNKELQKRIEKLEQKVK